MAGPILGPRSRVAPAKADKFLKCYAARLSPAEAAQRTQLSLNTVYDQYARIRWRLIEVGYYRDAAWSKDEDGLGEAARRELKRRRGLRPEDVYAHAAEAIEWAEDWPPASVLRHLRKIIALTGPLDSPMELSAVQERLVQAYVRYARTRLLHDRLKSNAALDSARASILEGVQEALQQDWRAYRAAAKQAERSELPPGKAKRERN